MKFGIPILGITGTEDDLDVVRTIGVCDEFTLFAAVAIQTPSPNLWAGPFGMSKSLRGLGSHSFD